MTDRIPEDEQNYYKLRGLVPADLRDGLGVWLRSASGRDIFNGAAAARVRSWSYPRLRPEADAYVKNDRVGFTIPAGASSRSEAAQGA